MLQQAQVDKQLPLTLQVFIVKFLDTLMQQTILTVLNIIDSKKQQILLLTHYRQIEDSFKLMLRRFLHQVILLVLA